MIRYLPLFGGMNLYFFFGECICKVPETWAMRRTLLLSRIGSRPRLKNRRARGALRSLVVSQSSSASDLIGLSAGLLKK